MLQMCVNNLLDLVDVIFNICIMCNVMCTRSTRTHVYVKRLLLHLLFKKTADKRTHGRV